MNYMKVLIVVDMQKDFVDGSLGTKEAQAIVPLVAETIEQMAAPDTVVIFTKDTHPDNYMSTLEGKNLPVPHCIKGTAGHSIVDEVFNAYIKVISNYANSYDVYPMADWNPIRIEKPTFGSMELIEYLRDIVQKDNGFSENGTMTFIPKNPAIIMGTVRVKKLWRRDAPSIAAAS